MNSTFREHISGTKDEMNDGTGECGATSVIAGVYIDARKRKAQPLPLEVRERVSLSMKPPGDRFDARFAPEGIEAGFQENICESPNR